MSGRATLARARNYTNPKAGWRNNPHHLLLNRLQASSSALAPSSALPSSTTILILVCFIDPSLQTKQ